VLSYSDIFFHLLIRLYYSLPVFCNYFLVFSVLILLSSRLLFVSLPGSCLLCAPLLVCLPCVSLLVLCLLAVLEKRDSSGNLFPSTRILKLADLSRGPRPAEGLLRNHSIYVVYVHTFSTSIHRSRLIDQINHNSENYSRLVSDSPVPYATFYTFNLTATVEDSYTAG
jgi:hypothetical protein